MPASSAVFEVKRLQITGATVYSEQALVRVAGFEPGRTLNLQGLQIMAQRITRHYQQAGYPVARAYLPAQEIRDGVVTLAVLEGQYGQVKLDNTSTLHSQLPRDLLDGLNPGDVMCQACRCVPAWCLVRHWVCLTWWCRSCPVPASAAVLTWTTQAIVTQVKTALVPRST
jgi:hypothetical protein